jgi:eukaryotic-like serine/threonine-protein kinase
VRPETLRDPQHAPKIRERFRREAQSLATMKSRHTIALYDYGVTDDGTFFYVMELLDGVDLDELVRAHGPQPAARVIELIAQACQSLAEAHEAGLLHRDIKPANVMTCRAADEVDVVKVLDFGIVHAMAEPVPDPAELVSLPPAALAPSGPSSSGRLTQAGALIGTPGYIAPEAAVGARSDGRADLYALACVAWWLLVGREVFPRDDEDAAIAAHAHAPVPALRPLVRGWLPDELERVIASCLAKDPHDRPADARALARVLRAIAIPPEHAWTDEHAHAWWRTHRPVEHAAAAIAPTRDDGGAASEQLLVPQRDTGSPLTRDGRAVKTVRARLGERKLG